MKKYFSLFSLFIFFSFVSFGQSPPESFKYQSIVRDASGNMLQNQNVNFQFTLIQGSTSGNTVYQEVFPVTTNNYGLVNLDIGTGSSVSGSFSAIDWSQGPYFIQTGLDITGGTNYSIMSTNELMSVPYALYAKTSGGGPPGPAGPAGPQGSTGQQGITGLDGNSGVVQQTVLNIGNSSCPNGGLLIESGLDLNNDGVLSSTEITSTGYVCNGDDALDNQNLTGASLTGTILQIDIDNGSSALVDLSALQDGVDDADNDPANEFNTNAVLNGNNLEITDGGGTQSVDLSAIQDGVDDADNDPSNEYNTNAVLNGNNLEITDGGGTQSVDLSALTGTGSDDQNLTGATLTGTSLQIDIETGNSVTVDLVALQDGVDDADNDPANEFNTNAVLNGNNLEITDGGGTQSVDLSALTGTGSDDQNLTGATLTGTSLQIDIETGNSVTVDLVALQDGVDDADNDPSNEYITNAVLNGNNLEITDGGGTQSVDLSALTGTGSDDQNLTGATLTGTSLQIDIETGNSVTVDLVALQDGVDDADNDPSNEYITNAVLNGNNLEITDGGGTQSVDLSSFADDGDWIVGTGIVYNSTDNIGIGTSSPTRKLHIAASSNDWPFMVRDNTSGVQLEFSRNSILQRGSAFNLEANESDIVFKTNPNPGTAITGLTDRITLKAASGYLGVGTTNPSSRLHVVQTDDFNSLDLEHSGNTGTILKATSTNTSNTSPGIDLTMDGTGIGLALVHNNNYAGGLIDLASTTNDYSGLQINHAGTGFGTSVFHAGTGFGHYIEMSNTTAANSNQAILGLHSGGNTTAAIRVGDFEYIGVETYDHIGVFGYSSPATGWGIGGQFQGGYMGVAGFGDDYGVVGLSGTTAAVFANGDLSASGVKAFMIDHPQDPENKLLKHFSIESDEILNIYRGVEKLDANGKVQIELSDYFEDINVNFSYQLTAIGTPEQPYILKEIKHNKFTIAGAPNSKVSWLVIAERNDEYLKRNPEKRANEVAKKGKEKGKYLMPELYNQPKSKGIFNVQEKARRQENKKAKTNSNKK